MSSDPLGEGIGIHINVRENFAHQTRPNSLRGMDRNNRAPAIRMLEEVVAALDPKNAETRPPQCGNHLTAPQTRKP